MWFKYNAFIQYRNNYVTKTQEKLSHYSSDEFDYDMADSNSFHINSRLTNNTGNNGIANVKVAKPSKYLSNSWKNSEVLLKNYEMSLDLACSTVFAICIADKETTFAIVDTKLYGPEISL